MVRLANGYLFAVAGGAGSPDFVVLAVFGRAALAGASATGSVRDEICHRAHRFEHRAVKEADAEPASATTIKTNSRPANPALDLPLHGQSGAMPTPNPLPRRPPAISHVMALGGRSEARSRGDHSRLPS